MSKNEATDVPADVQYVLDGGALLHKVIWPNGITYSKIFSLYVQYVKRKYGKAIVVFEGYQSGPSTKDYAHQRRGTTCAPSVNCFPNMVPKS